MIRKIILFMLGVAILGGAFIIARNFISSRQFPAPRENKVITSVFTRLVSNGDIPVKVSTNGLLRAKNRVELFSEVQGIFKSTSQDFKPGSYYAQESILLEIDKEEQVATLLSLKSSLLNQLVLLLPDLRLDYPESFPGWEEYVRNFDMTKAVRNFPEPKSEREKLFLSGRNIYTPYYSVKNLEERLEKYTLKAPFSGVLTEALVTKGTLIRTGQKLGEFIDPTIYELQVPVNTAYDDLVRVGQSVTLSNIEKTQLWEGKVIRINSLVDQATQSIQVFIQVSGKDLREGMYLEADLQARSIPNAFEIDRKLLTEENRVFYVRDTVLESIVVHPEFFKESTVIVTGLENGMKILARPVPGAASGMNVQVLQELTDAY